MKQTAAEDPEKLYLGVDVGGTKVQVSLVAEPGRKLESLRRPTPRDGGPEDVVAAIEQAMEETLAKAGTAPGHLTAVGIAIPGVVDPDLGRIVVTPNLNLTGVPIGSHLESRFRVPVAVGNDCNLGTLGEKWLGAAQGADSVVGILVGTGIGAGCIQGGRLWRGARESAGEIGHMIMQIDGPKCGCGNRGCFEALASRTAVQRDIRQAVAAGRATVLSSLSDGDLSIIRSGLLRRALAEKDELVTEIMRRASEVIGHACLTVRHLIDPELIVLGGGMVEACADFIMPIVGSVVDSDQLLGVLKGGRPVLSVLGDDAVVLGAVALARMLVGRSPFDHDSPRSPEYPKIEQTSFGRITIGGRTYTHDVYIRAGGEVKKRKKALAKQLYGSAHIVGRAELEKVCKGDPEVLFIGVGMSGMAKLSPDARQYLDQRSIPCEVLATPEVAGAYNKSPRRKAALIHVTC
jgi:glucokinase